MRRTACEWRREVAAERAAAWRTLDAGVAAVARRSGKERADGGDARPGVLTVVLKIAGPCVGPREGARGDARCCGQTVDRVSVLSWCGGAS